MLPLRSLSALTFAALMHATAAAASTGAAYEGPPRTDVDTVSPTVATVFATVPGPIERVTVRVQTSARYSDNLEIEIFHAGASVILYDGNGGDTIDAEINAGFADDVGGTYTTPGSVLGSVAPSPGSLSSFDGLEAAGPWELRIRNKYGSPDDGTDLLLWRVSITTGLAGPPVNVAVFDDGDFVDTVDDGMDPAEATGNNAKASLVELGHQVSAFQGTSAAAWSAGLAGRSVLLVPYLEKGDLGAALDESAETVIAVFVAGGGTLVKMGGQPNDLDFLNEVFGYALAPGAGTGPFPLRTGAIGTRFQQGPGSLAYDYLTIGLSGLPSNARSVYQELEAGDPVVAWIPFGSGVVVALGWDWHDAFPRGDQDGGWLEVLDRAVQGEARAISTRTVALYYDDNYVDLTEDGDPGEMEAEALNVEAALASLGHLPARFFGTDLLSFQQAFEAATVVEIPELEEGDLAGALPAEVILALEEFVAAGGVLIVHGEDEGRFALLLNEVFGFETSFGGFLNTQLVLESGLFDTRFEGCVANLRANDSTLELSNPPASARSIYESPEGLPGVVRIPYGSGKIIYLGWDFWDAAPRGTQDDGWRFVLDRAVLEAPLPAPEPGGAALAIAAGTALAALRRANRP